MKQCLLEKFQKYNIVVHIFIAKRSYFITIHISHIVIIIPSAGARFSLSCANYTMPPLYDLYFFIFI